MSQVSKKIRWSLPIAAGIMAPLALMPQRALCAIQEAIDWVGNDRLGSIAAATNALMLLP